MLSEHPVPIVTPLTQAQFDYAAEGVLALQHCTVDDSVWFPPSTNCPNCLSEDIEWRPVSGQGKLWSWVVIHQPYLAAFADETPYVVAAVKLDEGPVIMSTLVDIEVGDVTVDLPVTAEFRGYGPESTQMPVFRPIS